MLNEIANRRSPASGGYLFPRQKAKRRVMMHHTDAGPGNPNWARFQCKCGYETECGNVSDTELSRGRPCPKCNTDNDAGEPLPPTASTNDKKNV